jgi:hypothetical protein
MQFSDLGKVLEMIENRLGRGATTLAILVLYLAIIAVGLHTIATYLVVPTYNFLAAVLPPLGVEGVTVTTILYVGALLAVAILLGPAILFFWRVRRVPQRVLDHLAELRREAVQDILNGPVASGTDFDAWKIKDDDWWAKVVSYLKQHFPKSDVYPDSLKSR